MNTYPAERLGGGAWRNSACGCGGLHRAISSVKFKGVNAAAAYPRVEVSELCCLVLAPIQLLYRQFSSVGGLGSGDQTCQIRRGEFSAESRDAGQRSP